MLERDFSKQVSALLAASGLWYLRMNSGTIKKGSRFIKLHETGTPDWLIFAPCGVCWLETKGSGQKTQKARAEAQEAFRTRALNQGHKHLRTDNIEELAEWLRTIK